MLSARRPLNSGGHTDITGVDFGRRRGKPIAISTGAEGTVRLWKLPSLAPVGKPLVGTDAGYVRMRRGSGIFTTGEYGGRLHDLDTGRLMLKVPEKVTSFAAGTVDGVPVLFTGHREGVVKVWDLRKPSLKKRFKLGRRAVAKLAATVVGGRSLLVAQLGLTLATWEPRTGKRVGGVLQKSDMEENEDDGFFSDHRDKISMVRVDDRVLAITEHDGWLGAWDLNSRKQVNQELTYANETVDLDYSAFSAVGPLVLTGVSGLDLIKPGPTSGVQVWNVQGGQRKRFAEQAGKVTDLATGRLGGRTVVLTGSSENTIGLWDLASGRRLAKTPAAGPARTVNDIAVRTVGGRPVALTGGEDGRLHLWDLRTGRLTGRPMSTVSPSSPNADAMSDMQVALEELNGTPIALAANGALTAWDLTSFTRLDLLGRADKLALTRWNGRLLAVGAEKETGEVTSWDLTTRQRVHKLRLDPDTMYSPHVEEWGLSLHLAGGRPVAAFAAATVNDTAWPRKLRLWDVVSGSELPSLDISERLDIPSGGKLSTLASDIALFGLPGCEPVALLPDEHGNVRVHHLTTGRQLDRTLTLEGRLALVGTLRGRPIVVTKTAEQEFEDLDPSDYYVRFWDLVTGRPLTPRIDAPPISAMTLGELDGATVLVAVGLDERVWYWRIEP